MENIIYNNAEDFLLAWEDCPFYRTASYLIDVSEWSFVFIDRILIFKFNKRFYFIDKDLKRVEQIFGVSSEDDIDLLNGLSMLETINFVDISQSISKEESKELLLILKDVNEVDYDFSAELKAMEEIFVEHQKIKNFNKNRLVPIFTNRTAFHQYSANPSWFGSDVYISGFEYLGTKYIMVYNDGLTFQNVSFYEASDFFENPLYEYFRYNSNPTSEICSLIKQYPDFFQ